MLCFAHWNDAPEIKIIVGWSMIGFIGILLVINLGIILFNMGNTIKLILIKYFRIIARFCSKKISILCENCLGKSFNNPDSVKELIEAEKEKLR